MQVIDLSAGFSSRSSHSSGVVTLDYRTSCKLACAAFQRRVCLAIIYRELLKLGVPTWSAHQAAASTRHWWKNASKALNNALPNSYYDRQGVPRLAA